MDGRVGLASDVPVGAFLGDDVRCRHGLPDVGHDGVDDVVLVQDVRGLGQTTDATHSSSSSTSVPIWDA